MKNFITVGKLFILSFLFLLNSPGLFGQSAYWQQRTDVQIDVTLDDIHHFLNGEMHINYVNNSPDSLHFIYFHLYPNAYKNDQTAYTKQTVEDRDKGFYFSKEEDRGYIDSLNFQVDNLNAQIENTEHIDIIKLLLPKTLQPGDSVQIHTPFRVKIPYAFSRMGRNGQAYQISQWFPKPAVYDSKGWHPFPYLNQGEFYSEFGSYTVSVTLPENYILMGTGNMVDADKEIKWLDSLAALPLPSDTLYKKSFPISSSKFKTITFHENNVHDFAWFADKRWIVRKDSLSLPDENESVIGYRCFLPQHQKGWRNSLKTLQTAVYRYSQEVGIYPYKTIKIVDGVLASNAGGMEYPTIAVIIGSNDVGLVDLTIMHEVGHNWFYGILGSNERAYPWLDEGINSFYEKKFSTTRTTTLKGLPINLWIYRLLSADWELARSDTHSAYYPSLNYGIDLYEKVPLLLFWLENYMKPEVFRTAMQDYYQSYRFKHPQPEDFKRIFEKHSEQDISWFFDALKDERPIDFKVSYFSQTEDSIFIQLKNKTGFKGPVLLNFVESGEDSVHFGFWTPAFEDGLRLHIATPFPGTKWEKVFIDSSIPDYNPTNNANTTTLSVRPFIGLNNEHKKTMWLLPSVGYNYYDGLMLGVTAHNITIPGNAFQYALTPLFGFGSLQLAGTGFLKYTQHYRFGKLKNIEYKLEGKHFGHHKSKLNIPRPLTASYTKISPEIVFNFRNKDVRSQEKRTLSWKAYWINEENLNFKQDAADQLYKPELQKGNDYFYTKINYQYAHHRSMNPYGYSFETQIGKQFTKLSAEADLRADYFMKGKAFYIRAYLGKVFFFSKNHPNWQRYALTTTYSGAHDYLFDEIYFARNLAIPHIFSNQISMKEGGFKMHTLQYADIVGLSDNWLGAINLQSDIPVRKLPLKIFGDIAFLPSAANMSGISVQYEAGISFNPIKGFGIYVPLILSKDLNDYSKYILGKNRFLKSIAFEIDLNQIQVSKLSELIRKM